MDGWQIRDRNGNPRHIYLSEVGSNYCKVSNQTRKFSTSHVLIHDWIAGGAHSFTHIYTILGAVRSSLCLPHQSVTCSSANNSVKCNTTNTNVFCITTLLRLNVFPCQNSSADFRSSFNLHLKFLSHYSNTKRFFASKYFYLLHICEESASLFISY